MKKYFMGAAVALLTIASASVTAKAGYDIDTQQDGNTVTVEVTADSVTLPAIEFAVELPEGVEADEVHTADGAVYNEENGKFAWAGVEAPADGTVMYSATFTVADGYEGKFSILPEEGYEEEIADPLTTVITAVYNGSGTADDAGTGSVAAEAVDSGQTVEKTGASVGAIVAILIGAVVVIGGAIVYFTGKKKE